VLYCVCKCVGLRNSQKTSIERDGEEGGWVGVGGNFVENFSQVPTQGWILIEWPIKARG
jgi:hypothetical protein